jgi:transcriptional regulator with XRE-family HTH domain
VIPTDSAFPSDRYLRVARRAADMSQRELAEAAGVPQSVVARAERYPDRLRVAVFELLLKATNHRLVVVDSNGRELAPETESSADLRNRAGCRFPPHLDVVSTADGGWWWGYKFWLPCERMPPEHTFRRSRLWRDLGRYSAAREAAARDRAADDTADP